ncbi:MAG: YybS family protein [Peptococcaceae bacterium]|jgi:uncharacterized protein YybS (DUF2232 family)|nr:YybS family protein [Peptococcaceae bacterium]
MAKPKLTLETGALTEGAAMAALTAVLGTAGLYLPIIGLVAMFAWTLPVVAVCLRRGMRAGALTLGAAALIILMVTSPLIALSRVLSFAAPALLLGYALRRRWSTSLTIFVCGGAEFVSILLSLLLSLLLTGVSSLGLEEEMDQMLTTIINALEQGGVFAGGQVTAEQYMTLMRDVMDNLMLLLPAMLLLSAFGTSLINYFLAAKVFGRLRLPVPPVGRLGAFRLPWWLVYGLIAGLACSLLRAYVFPAQAALTRVGSNLVLVFLLLYTVQGIAVAANFWRKIPSGARWPAGFMLLLLTVGFLPVVFTAVTLLGLADGFADFRRLGRPKSA